MTRIVIIEDHPVLISVYRNKFIAEGYQVEIATDGESGLELINRIRPNLVVLDLAMPKLNGIQVLRRLRLNPLFGDLPVIIFSDSAWKQQAWKEGATVVLSKSRHTPSQVVDAVRTALLTYESLQTEEIRETNSAVPVAEAASPESGIQSPRTKGRVLLVEDHDDLRITISASLEGAGFDVTAVECHAAAWHQVEAREFDAYLLNRVCPDGLGIALCRKLRQLYKHKPIVLYSTVSVPFTAEQRLDAGASEYLMQARDALNPGPILLKLIDDARSNSGYVDAKVESELSATTA